MRSFSFEALRHAGIKEFSAYMVALEAWRRGLDVTFYTPRSFASRAIKLRKTKSHIGNAFSISDGKNIHFFFKSRGDKNPFSSFGNTASKVKALSLLRNESVSAPVGHVVSTSASKEELLGVAADIGWPLVVKPTNSGQGKGVFVGLESENDYLEAVAHIKNNLVCERILVERFYKGDDLRVYIIGDRVAGVLLRRPAQVVGDGESSILALIDKKNKERLENPYLNRKLIKFDGEVARNLKKQGFSESSIPDRSTVVRLRSEANLSKGGDSIIVTDKIPEYVKELAVKACRATGLVHGGVDIIFDLEAPDDSDAVVLELGSAAEFGMMFPTEGSPVDLASELVDFYFPESIGSKSANSSYYFDLGKIRQILHDGAVGKVSLPRLSTDCQELLVFGDELAERQEKKFIALAEIFGLDGYVKRLESGGFEAVFSGSPSVLKKIKNVLQKNFAFNHSEVREHGGFDIWPGFKVLGGDVFNL